MSHTSAIAPRGRGDWLTSVALACTLHGGCMLYFVHTHARTVAAPALRELEVEMLAPEPPAPPPTPAPPRPAAEPVEPARAPARTRAAAPPAPAHAGALLTQPEPATPAPQQDEPVRFVTDPNGRGYGSGLVARGGRAEHAEEAAVVAPERSAVAKARLVFAPHLSRQPMLAESDPCRGYFPRNAQSDRGDVTVIATIQARGAVVATEIETEEPAGQGFAAAARACLGQQRFQPALDDDGKATAARTRVKIRFSR